MTIQEAIQLSIRENYLFYRRMMLPPKEAFSLAKQWSSECMVRAGWKERGLKLVD